MKRFDIKNSIFGIVSIALLSGCGGGDSADSSTVVTVERGAVYDTTVTDSAGNIAIQIANKNQYRFSSNITYPISASGGWCDIDGDGVMDEDDIVLQTTLKSNSTNITPATTAIAQYGCEAIQVISSLSCSELNTLSSLGSKELASFNNALYKNAIEKNVSIKDIVYSDDMVDDYNDYKTISDGMANSYSSMELERYVVSNNIGTFSYVDALMVNENKKARIEFESSSLWIYTNHPKDDCSDVAVRLSQTEAFGSYKNIEGTYFDGIKSCEQFGITNADVSSSSISCFGYDSGYDTNSSCVVSYDK